MAALRFLNRCVFTPTSGGTGDFTVSAAVTGYLTPASAGATDAMSYHYFAQSADRTQWEVGSGTYTVSGTVLSRTPTLSSNSNNLVNFTTAPTVHMGCPLAADVQSTVFDVKRDFGAKGNNAADDTAAIQAAIDFCDAQSAAAGVVFFPPGHYKTTSKITVPSGVFLIGSGVDATIIDCGNSDITVLEFTTSGGMEKIFVAGLQSGSGTQPTVIVGTGARVYFRDCWMWGGLYGLKTAGDDCTYDNCFIAAMASTGAHLYSNGGSSWYHRCKMDDVGVTVARGLLLDLGAAAIDMENTFHQCDFSGSFTTGSIDINDGGGSVKAYTTFLGCVVSSAVSLTTGGMTNFGNNRFGAQITVNSNSPTILTGNHSISSQTVAGTNTVKAGNVNIS